ncbi:helix-turn-helix domain-containing protein [Oceanobacillus kimchii]|uniref:helix-turn-helix domain-containing protein n=1 Tax=Oceanobacillus kimchii TaxID=746691 RepID=UPI003B02D35B
MFNERLKYIRKKRGLSQEGLAKKLNTTKGTVSNYENKYSSPSNETLAEIANVLNVTTDYLLGRSDREALTEKESEEYDEILNIIRKLEDAGKEKELESLKAYTKFLANALENED